MKAIKNITIAISFLLSPLAFANGGVYSTEFSKIVLNPAHSQNQNILAAAIKVDADNGEIILSMQPEQTPCPEGMYCIAVMPFPVHIILPIVKMERDGCGNMIYVAEREISNGWSQITVSNNSENNCPTFMEISPTEVYYRSVQGNNDITSIFSGSALKAEVNIAPIHSNIF